MDTAAGRLSTPPHSITEEHLMLAVRHGLIGLLAHSSNGEERQAALPVFARLKAHQEVMVRNMRRLLTSLHGHGIPAAVLKGPKLAVDGYAVTDHRTFTDIDLLIPAHRVDDALEVLKQDEGVPAIPPKTPKADKRNVPVMDPSGIGFNLDLHWDLFSYSQLRGCAKGATEWAWSNAEIDAHHTLGPLWELPEAAVLAFLGTHAVLDHRFRLVLFRDLAEVAQREPDWDIVQRFTLRWGLRSTTYVALLLARSIADARIDETYLDELRPGSVPIRAVEALLPRVDIVHFDGHQIHPLNLAMVMLHDDRTERLRLLTQAPLSFPAWRRRVGAGVGTLPTGERRRQAAQVQQGAAGSLTLHVLPVDLARGAQTYAEALSRTLDGEQGEHRTMTIFESEPIALHADIELGASPGIARRLGFDPTAAWRLYRALRHLRPDIVVAHGGESLKYASLTTPRSTHLVYYKIGTSRVHLANWLRRLSYRLVSLRCDIVAGVSREMVTEATDVLGVSRTRAVYAPNGRDPVRFLPWRGSPSELVRFVFVGHVTRTKRPERFVEVIRRLAEQGDEVEGILVGDGPMLSHVELVAKELPVSVVGRREDVPEILSESDVFVFTSLEEGEGMPGVLIEASLAGLPVLTTDVPGAHTVIEDGVTGFVVGVDDMEGFVEAAHRLATDGALRRRMGEAARAKALAEFTLEASVDHWRRLLSGLVGNGAGREQS